MADNEKELVIDYRLIGATGLRRFSGFIFEEFLPELTGWRGAQVYKEMSHNDSVVEGILYAIDKIIRAVPWSVHPASETEFDQEAADFLESCMDDMDVPWIEFIAEVMSMLPYGYSVHEINYKRRCGDGFDPTMRSKYSDGRIGWRSIPIRSQDTIYRWQFDDHGGIQGVEQLAPPHYYHVTIPAEKMLLFRTTVHKNNPEGKSILRGAYRSWYMKKNIENIEAIGIERDLAGIPMMEVPAAIMSTNASASQKALFQRLQNIVTNVRRDEQEGIILPQVRDDKGNKQYEFKLLTTGGTRQIDVDKVINRYDQRIAMSCLADFLLLGHNGVGAYNMVVDRRELFAKALGTFLDIAAEVLNRYAVPRLFALNDFRITEHPKFIHADVNSVDLDKLGNYLLRLAQSGMPLFPDEELEKFCRKSAGMPEAVGPAKPVDQQVAPEENNKDKEIKEIPGLPIQTPTGLDKPSDTTPVNGKPPVETVTTNANGNTERTSRSAFDRQQTPMQYTDWRKW